MFLYGISGMGVNMLNLMIGSYICSALIATGFVESALPYHTYLGVDLVYIAAWTVIAVIAKIIDGIIDIPMAAFADKLNTKWGRRRPAILLGLVLTILAYVAMLAIPTQTASWINTIYFGIMLCVFYTFYTLTMVTYYATFAEIVDNGKDRDFISNVKSVCDIVYFILGYVLVPLMLKGMNIRLVSLIVLPIVLTMLIPMFLIKEGRVTDEAREKDEKTVGLVKSLVYTFKDKDFILWMIIYSFMTFGVQLFLGGINEYFTTVNMSMTYVMIGAFLPIPAMLVLYNKLIKKFGFRFAFQCVLLNFAAGMLLLFGFSYMAESLSRTILSILAGIICSFSVGAMFSVAYSIPSHLAAEDEKRTGISHSAMYFAVQGLFAGIASGIGSVAVLNILKKTSTVPLLTLIAAIGCICAFALTYILPRSVAELGKALNIDKNKQ
jgi:Na+/melibiose symporter-like transporter